MKTQINSLFIAIATTIVLGSTALAQQGTLQQPQTDQIVPQQKYVLPGPGVEPIQPIQQNPYYFGMSVVVKRNAWGRTTLQIVSVTPGSPAHQAGLEVGDEIRRVNGRGFRFASNAWDAVAKLNRYVITAPVGGGPAPAGGGVAAAYVAFPQPTVPLAKMVVRNVRNGQDVVVKVFPKRVGAPAVAAAAVSAGS